MDWGYAPEYVEAMWRILQQKEPGDYVLGTGQSYPVREFLDAAFSYAGLDRGEFVKIDKRYFRPTEVDFLVADASKARRELKLDLRIGLKDLVRIMVDADMRAAGLKPIGEGDKVLLKTLPDRWWKAD